jgi:hypothetical protein
MATWEKDDWEAFAPSGQYQSELSSPWGGSNSGSNNADLYKQQFAKLLAGEQDYQNRAFEAQGLRQAAQDDPFQASPTDWSWVNNADGSTGLKDVNISTGSTNQIPTEWGLNPNLTSDMSNTDMVGSLNNIFSDNDLFGLQKHPEYIEAGDFSSRESVNDWISNNPNKNDKKWSSAIAKLGQNIYTPTSSAAAASAPVGYAQPN